MCIKGKMDCDLIFWDRKQKENWMEDGLQRRGVQRMEMAVEEGCGSLSGD